MRYEPVRPVVRCPDCLLYLQLPLVHDGTAVYVDEAYAEDLRRHVDANPEAHPTFLGALY